MKVLLLSKYPRKGASSRLRSLQYLSDLADEGEEVAAIMINLIEGDQGLSERCAKIAHGMFSL